MSKFPSPYGVSFILIIMTIISNHFVASEFPSPYGVSFILIQNIQIQKLALAMRFPSPCGVSFITISIAKSNAILKIILISVSLWSYTHFYTIVKKEFYHNKFLEYYCLIFLFLNFLFVSNKSIFNSSFFRYYPITIFFLI